MTINIISIKKLNRGENVGYNREFTTKRESTVAVIPIGYSDGFAVEFEPNHVSFIKMIKHILKYFFKFLGIKLYRKYVLINNKKAYVIGKISMQHSMIDITDFPDVSLGDEVTVLTRRLAINETIPRIYLKNEEELDNITDVNIDVNLKSS